MIKLDFSKHWQGNAEDTDTCWLDNFMLFLLERKHLQLWVRYCNGRGTET